MIPRGSAPAALVVLALLVAACAPTAPSGTLPPSTLTASEAAAALEEAEAGVRTLRGLADVRLERGDRQDRFREAAVLALPDKFRLETLQFGGAAAVVVAADGDDLAIYSLATREFARGRASAAALERLAGVAMEPRQLVRLLGGLPPLPFRRADPRSRLEPDGSAFVAQSVAGPFWQRLRLDPGGRVTGGDLHTASAPALTFRFEDVRQVDGHAFPFRVEVEQPGVGRVEVRYRTVELNPSLDPGVFSLPPPAADVRVLSLDQLRLR